MVNEFEISFSSLYCVIINCMNNSLRHSIMPDHSTLESWLGTRKTARGKHIGIFQTHNYSKDNSMFWVAMFGEIVGGLLLLYGLFAFYGGSGFYTIGITIAVILGVGLDYLLALHLHRNIGYFRFVNIFRNINNRNQNSEDINAKLYRINKDITKPKHTIIDITCKTLLYVVGLFKAIVFVELFSGFIQQPVVYVACAIGYLLIAFIHIKHTGYRHAEMVFQKKYRKCTDSWSKESGDDRSSHKYRILSVEKFGPAAYSQRTFQSDGIDIKEIDLGNVKVEKIGNEYVIKYLGLVFDDEIDQIRAQQSDTKAKDLIDEIGMQIQFDLLPNILKTND